MLPCRRPSTGKKGRKSFFKKQKPAAIQFEPRAALAYYGTIGGGFGTPRVGVALGQFNVPAWMTVRPSGELIVSSTFANEVQLLSARGGPFALVRTRRPWRRASRVNLEVDGFELVSFGKFFLRRGAGPVGGSRLE